jgi:hypothetical protein
MTDSPNGNKSFLFSTWRAIDPIYVWSAVIGLVVALVLIAIGIAMGTRAPQ